MGCAEIAFFAAQIRGSWGRRNRENAKIAFLGFFVRILLVYRDLPYSNMYRWCFYARMRLLSTE